jgi:phage tail sheath protein FI
MATQVSYPGIYIQEFTPGAPIQGVATSIAAFIGTATSGPINQAIQITNWDEFQSIFGGFINEPPNTATALRSWLAPAVYGFFLNGGTTCWIIRAVVLPSGVTSLMASSNLPTQPPSALVPSPPPPWAPSTDLVVTAIAEGTIGNSISVQVVESSRLATMLTLAGAGFTQLTTTGPLTAGQLTFQVTLPASPSTFVLSQALPPGALISVTSGGTTEDATVSSSGVVSPGIGTITLASGLVNAYPAAPEIESLEFDLNVTAATTEKWPQLSMNPIHPNYWQTVVNSKLITLSLPAAPPDPTPENPNPAAGIYALGGGYNDVRVNDLTDPTNGINSNPNLYLNLLTPLQNVDIVAIPGNTNANVQQAVVTHCETMFNRFGVLDGLAVDATPGYTLLQAQYGQVRTPNGFAAIYFPWIQVVNPANGVTEYWPPSGHVIGIYAQTDSAIGVYKAPANVAIAGALGLPYLLSDADQGPLNLLGINILRVFPEQSQPLVWGARTTSTDSNWQYVNVRRLFIFLEQSIEQGIRWAVFQPNNTMLWGQLKRTITDFLNRFQGDGGITSFYVRIDAALNPPASLALGQLYIEVGIQPTYPAEFIILRIGIWQGGSTVTES